MVRLQALFPYLLKKQRAAGSLCARTQPWQVLLPPVELMETSEKLILLVTGSLTAVDSGCPCGIAVLHPLQDIMWLQVDVEHRMDIQHGSSSADSIPSAEDVTSPSFLF